MQRFACPHGTAEIVCTRPASDLRRAVRAYRGFRVDRGLPVRRLGLPSGDVTLLLGFDHALQLRYTDAEQRMSAPLTSLVAGPSIGASVFEHPGSAYGVEAILRPWAAFTLLGVRMQDLTDRVVEPGALLGDRLHELAEALAVLPGWPERFGLLDAVLPMWFARGPAWSPRVQWAYGELVRSGGRTPIRQLAVATGWSRRQLEYRFQEQIGLAPKVAARVLRFQRAVRRLAAGRLPGWAAADCGFSDQAHLTREFRAMTGLTPRAFRGRSLAATGPTEESERATGSIRSVVAAG